MSSETASIDLNRHELLARFFEGWDTRKAQEFAQNLLLIGVGVAYKLLNSNTPDEAFHKLRTMAQNVVKEYSKIDDGGSQQQIDYQLAQVNKGSSLSKRTAQFSNAKQDNNSNQRERTSSEEQIRREIQNVQQKLEKLTQRLRQQNAQISLPNSQIPSRIINKRRRFLSPVTPKITQSPPPHLVNPYPDRQQRQSFSNSRRHLNDEGIKECMKNQHDRHKTEEYQDFRSPPRSMEGLSNSLYLSQVRDSGVPRSSERFSSAYFSTGLNFLSPKQPHHVPSKKERAQQKKAREEEFKRKQAEKEIQRQFRSKSPSYYKQVESRIKNEILADREQHAQNQDADRTRDPDDFKQMMIQENAPADQQNQEQACPNQQDNKEDKSDIINEMGVVFSREAQRKFYEKKDKEMKKQQQQLEKNKGINSDQEEIKGHQALQSQPNWQQSQQEQQQYDLTYPRQNILAPPQIQQSRTKYQQIVNKQQQSQQLQPYQKYQGEVINPLEDVRYQGPRGGANGASSRIREKPNPQLFDQEQNNQTNKNILEIANSFLQSPLMRQFNEEDPSSQQQIIENNSNQYQQFQQYPDKYQIQGGLDGRNRQLASSQETTQNMFYNPEEAPKSLQQFPSFHPSIESPIQDQSENLYQQQQDKLTYPRPNDVIYQPQYPFYSPEQRSLIAMMQSNITSTAQENPPSGRQQQHNTSNKIDSRQVSGNDMQSPAMMMQSLKFSKAGSEGFLRMNQGGGGGQDDSQETNFEFDPRYSGYHQMQQFDGGRQQGYSEQQGQQQHAKQLRNSDYQAQSQVLFRQQLPSNQKDMQAYAKQEEQFRESINNSDFTMPNEEMLQFFKNQNFNFK